MELKSLSMVVLLAMVVGPTAVSLGQYNYYQQTYFQPVLTVSGPYRAADDSNYINDDEYLLQPKGPNDDMPLNRVTGKCMVQLSVVSPMPAHLVYHDANGRMIVIPVSASGEGVSVSVITIDSREYANGSATIQFHLYDERLSTLYDTKSLTFQVENPTISVLGPRDWESLVVQLNGTSGDLWYVLAVGPHPEIEAPPTANQPETVQNLTTRQFSYVQSSGTPSGKSVLKPCNIIQDFGVHGYLVLWCQDSRSNWSCSKRIPLSRLLKALWDLPIVSY